MTMTDVTIRVDNDIEAEARAVLTSLGLDINTAINVFLRQVIRKQGIPFDITAERSRRMPRLGGWEGKIEMADDFDAPLEDFKEYMV